MILNQADIRSPMWVKMKKHLEDRLADHRRTLDNDLDERVTTRTRGRILELKYLLDLGQEAGPE